MVLEWEHDTKKSNVRVEEGNIEIKKPLKPFIKMNRPVKKLSTPDTKGVAILPYEKIPTKSTDSDHFSIERDFVKLNITSTPNAVNERQHNVQDVEKRLKDCVKSGKHEFKLYGATKEKVWKRMARRNSMKVIQCDNYLIFKTKGKEDLKREKEMREKKKQRKEEKKEKEKENKERKEKKDETIKQNGKIPLKEKIHLKEDSLNKFDVDTERAINSFLSNQSQNSLKIPILENSVLFNKFPTQNFSIEKKDSILLVHRMSVDSFLVDFTISNKMEISLLTTLKYLKRIKKFSNAVGFKFKVLSHEIKISK